MRKQFMASILVLCMVITLLPTTAFAETIVKSGTCGDNLTWTLTDDGTMTISGSGEMDDYDNFDGSNPNVWRPGIRDQVLKVIINQGVTSIGADSFRGFSSLKEVSLPNSLKQIGETAFSGCSALERVELSINVENVGPQAFANCSNLSYINISSDKTLMGDLDNPNIIDDVFRSCPLLKTAGPIGSGCNIEFAWKDEIPNQAFEGCQSLESIIFPSGVKRIGERAFNQCMALKSVVIPDSVTEIGFEAFSMCRAMTKVVIPKNATFMHEEPTPEGGVIISGGFAFASCDSLVTAGSIGSGCNIEYGWTDTIPQNAFRGCESLAAITIPVSITTIEKGAFQQTGIKEVYYMGSKEQWEAVNYAGAAILDPIPTATIHFNSSGSKPMLPDNPMVSDGTDPNTSRLYITKFTPNHISIPLSSVALSFTFNENVTKRSGNIEIHIQENGTVIGSIPINSSYVTVSGNQVTLDISGLQFLTSGTLYYITIDSGTFASANGDLFHGINNPEQWEFQVDKVSLKASDIPLQWEKKGHLWWKSDDYDKPPVPVGTDADYAKLLRSWAIEAGRVFTTEQALALLDMPVYFPTTDVNGSPVLLFDDATTVRQVMMDLVFLENLKPYVDNLDKSLADIQRYNDSGLHLNSLWQERDVYQDTITWYTQINRFMKLRDGDSNFFYSAAAPLAYQAMQEAIGKTGDLSTVLRATLNSVETEASVKNLQSYADYTELKKSAQQIKTLYNAGKTLYTATTANGKGIVKFGTDILKQYFKNQDTGSRGTFLKNLVESWETFDDVKSAVSVSMMLGSSIGMFPLVMDFATKFFSKIDESTRAFYFIGDYYIYEKYPTLYDVIYDDVTCLPKDDISWFDLIDDALYDYNHRDDDPILYNWSEYLTKITEQATRENCKEMRYDLVNYIQLLKYAKQSDTNAQKRALVDYIVSEKAARSTIGIGVSCPVIVKLYDSNNELVAAISTKDENLQECKYGTLYLLGENGETKYLLVDQNEYRVEIEPYVDESMENSMDILIVDTAADGTQSSTYYENVPLEGVSSITTTTSGKELQVNGLNGSLTAVQPKEEIPVTSVAISGPEQLAVGEAVQLEAAVYPSVATNQALTWSSSNQSVATVDNAGRVTALSEGKTVITAESVHGPFAAFELEIYAPAVGITINQSTVHLCASETYALLAQIEGSTTRPITWQSSDMHIAAVDENGVIYGLSEGTTILTAEVDGHVAEVLVSVSNNPIDVSLYQSDVDGMRLKVTLANASCLHDFAGTIYAAIYKDGQMISIHHIASELEHSAIQVLYCPLNCPENDGNYSAKAFILDEHSAPIQINAEINVLPAN